MRNLVAQGYRWSGFKSPRQSVKLIDEIRDAEENGLIGREYCPRETHWNWPVPDPSNLEGRLLAIYNEYGEIRWYFGEDF